MQTNHSSILALDIGTVRIGIAIASYESRLARPLTTLPNDENFTEQLRLIVKNENVGHIIAGLPRGLSGQETAQTQWVRDFVRRLTLAFTELPLSFQDEALSSIRATTELGARGRPYNKAEVDALAATYILEDYLQHMEEAQ